MFYQDPPQYANPYDEFVQSYVKSFIDSKLFDKMDKNLKKFGERVQGEISNLSSIANSQDPTLMNFDVWGNRVDKVSVSPAWEKLHEIAAEEGLISIGYERAYSEYSRIFQMLKLFLYTPASAMVTCPLAMTDGAAKLIETYAPELKDVFNHLTSENPDEFWTAGQWMTEREGGSDVGESSTIARKLNTTEDKSYLLTGDKWFTSAITANIAMTLARIEKDGTKIEGSRGLSLFFLYIRDENGKLNGITINRLKDKLGTKALPTAELSLKDCKATQIGEIGRGVKLITTILNMTRIYNAVSSISYIHRTLLLAEDYTRRRKAFGAILSELPLHKVTLEEVRHEYIGNFLLTFFVVELLGKSEVNVATEEEKILLRLLTPIVKLYTGKASVKLISELVECFGGAGYLEETEIPVLFRDAQVFPIWEGTTNVLSLDVLRVLNKTNALNKWVDWVNRYSNDVISTNVQNLLGFAAKASKEEFERNARKISFSIAEITIFCLIERFLSISPSDMLEKPREFWLNSLKYQKPIE